MSPPRRRSLIQRPKSSGAHELEALEATEDSDLDEFDNFGAEDEDLEVVEPTLRTQTKGSFDEVIGRIDSAVMDEYTDELPAAGLWMDDHARKAVRSADDVFRKLDPAEYELTEPGLAREDLLPPPQQQARERVEGRKRTPTPPPARPRQAIAAAAEVRASEADRFLSRTATGDERKLAEATPWLAAMGLSIGVGAGGLVLVVLAAFLLSNLRRTEEPVVLGEQPAITAPAPEPVEEVPVEEVAVEPPVEEAPTAAPSPRPKAAPAAPAPEPEPAPAPAPVAPAPKPAPAPAPVVEDDKKGGLFGKKKK